MELTIEQKDIARAAREFAEKEFRDRAKEFDEKEGFDLSIWKRAAKNGFVGVFIKEKYGGAGLGFLDHSLISEEFWRVDPGCGHAVLSCTLGAEIVQAFGSEELKKKYLPPLAKGEAIMGAAITEADAGSDVAGIKTKAEKKGGQIYYQRLKDVHFKWVDCKPHSPSLFNRSRCRKSTRKA
jgi:acyl-CoA dehydrogenase